VRDPASPIHERSSRTRSTSRPWGILRGGGGLVASGVLALAGATFAPPVTAVGAATLRVQGTAFPGASVVVSGSSFAPRAVVGLTWDGASGILPTVTAGRSGSFSTAATIPGGAVPGTHTLGAVVGTGSSPGGRGGMTFTISAGQTVAAIPVQVLVRGQPSPSPTPSATATPTPTATTNPTATPTPTATTNPTAAPTPAVTPAPVPSPSIAASPTATASPTPVAPCGSSLQARLDATPAGGTADLTGCTYVVSVPATVDHAISIRGGAVSAGAGGLLITASNVSVTGMSLSGPGDDADRGHVGIRVQGSGPASPLTGISLVGNTLSSWDGEGIHLQFADRFDISGNAIADTWYAGIGAMSVTNGTIAGNWVHRVVGTGNSYGIYLSRGYGGGLAGNPPSSDVAVSGNTIEDVPNWEGLDTHAGRRIQFTNNTIRRVLSPIMVGGCPDVSGGTLLFAPLDVTVSGNIIESGVTDGSMAGEGIFFGGANAGNGIAGAWNELATGRITGNRITGYGLQSSGEYSAIKVSDTENLEISGNTLSEPSSSGIQIYLNNVNFLVTGNTITDAWSDSLDYAFAIYVHADDNTGTVSANTFIRGSRTARAVMTSNVEVNGYPHNSVTTQ
jgi:hypothetical protein